MKYRWMTRLLYGYFGVCFLAVAGLGTYWKTYKSIPPQPIAFPHKTHVSKVGLACTECHTYADKAKLPGIPPISKCMSCHKAVAVDSPEIRKLTEYWKQKKPIQWVRVNKLPDYVYFSHKRHVKRNIACQTCHGQIQAEMSVHKAKSLTMGFCVSCHKANQAPTDCYTCHK